MGTTAFKMVPTEATHEQLMAAVRVYLDVKKQHSYAELYKTMVAEAPAQAAFKVSVATMKASNGTRYLVCIDRWDRPAEAKAWDAGRVHPFESAVRENAESEAAMWAAFLGAELVPTAD